MAKANKYWTDNGELHRIDGPALIRGDGTREWYQFGKLHRDEDDGPAIEHCDGSKAWYLNGELHRENGPAVEYADGTQSWYLHGERTAKSPKITRLQKILSENMDIEDVRSLSKSLVAAKSIKRIEEFKNELIEEAALNMMEIRALKDAVSFDPDAELEEIEVEPKRNFFSPGTLMTVAALIPVAATGVLIAAAVAMVGGEVKPDPAGLPVAVENVDYRKDVEDIDYVDHRKDVGVFEQLDYGHPFAASTTAEDVDYQHPAASTTAENVDRKVIHTNSDDAETTVEEAPGLAFPRRLR